MFETEREVLDWYERQPRALTTTFVKNFPWREVPIYPLDPRLVPVLFYMRDTEIYTEIYRDELLRTPTGRDPVIRKFLDRWLVEEDQHGETLNRFLDEAGVRGSASWRAEAKRGVTWRYTLENLITSHVASCFGRHFTGTHMAWGAINELTVVQGYRRLWQLAGHPALESLLRAIAHEETLHARFFWSIARINLDRSQFSREVARFVIAKFWSPVGQGTKPQRETDYAIATLFDGASGVECFDKHVTQRAEQLPGLAGLKTATERIAGISLPSASSLNL